MKAFPKNSRKHSLRNQERMLAILFLFNMILEVIANATRKEKEIIGIYWK